MEGGFEKELVGALKDVAKGSNWCKVGTEEMFKRRKCTRLYADDGEDIVLIYIPDKDNFYALDAACAHEGGPLEQGDIEDFDGRWKVICPWHCYDFDIETGKSSSGLMQDTYEVHVELGNVYIYTGTELSLTPIREKTVTEPAKNDPSIETLTVDDNSLTYWATKILNTADPFEKVRLTHEVGKRWREGEIETVGHCTPPDQPSRGDNLTVVAPGKEKKRGKGGSLSSRISNLHSLANIEQWAIDLSWDIIARFANSSPPGNGDRLPKEFFDDFVKVACDEAKHFTLISDRLSALDSHFGALPVHGALWETARETSDSVMARLAIVHMVHEARGLDVQPKTLEKFANHKDMESVKVLEVIYSDEITHVAAGLKWFTYICKHANPPLDCIPTFHDLVKKYFRGYLKPPFNMEGRKTAGMTEEWYLPLVKPSS